MPGLPFLHSALLLLCLTHAADILRMAGRLGGHTGAGIQSEAREARAASQPESAVVFLRQASVSPAALAKDETGPSVFATLVSRTWACVSSLPSAYEPGRTFFPSLPLYRLYGVQQE